MKFGTTKNRIALSALLALFLILGGVSQVFALAIVDRIGMSETQSGANDNEVARGGTVYVKFRLDDMTDLTPKNIRAANGTYAAVSWRAYNGDPSIATLQATGTAAVSIVSDTNSIGTTTLIYSFTVPQTVSENATTIIPRFRFVYTDLDDIYYETGLYVSRATVSGSTTVNNAADLGTTFTVTYMNLYTPPNTPTITYPGTGWQSGHDDDSIRVRFSIPYTASATSVIARFISSGTDQEIIFTNTSIGDYSCRLIYSGGSFAVEASSNDAGTTLPTISSQTNTNALVDGSTYTFRLLYTKSSNATEYSSDFASFVYDLNTLGVSWDLPTAGTYITVNGSPDNYAFQWDNPEPYSSLKMQFINATDLNSPHELTLASSFLTSGNNKTVTVDLSNLADGANFTYNNSNGTALEIGKTYTCRMTATDAVGNSATNTNTSFITSDGTTTAPTFTTPASSGRDNTSLSLAYTLNEQAYDGTVKLRWFPAGGPYADANVIRTWTMTSEQSGSHTGSVTLTDGLVTTGGGSNTDFGVNVATDSGSTAITAGTYDLRLDMRDSDNNPVASSSVHTSFTMDTQTATPTITSPASSTSGTSFAMVYDQPEAASTGTKTVTFTRTGGSADGNTHVLIFTAGNLAAGNGQTNTFSGSDLDGAGTVVTLQGGSSNVLVNGAYYTVTLSYQDDLGNSAASYSVTNWMYSTSSNNANVTGTSYAGLLGNNPANIVNKRVYRVSMYTNSATNTLTSLMFTIGGSANSSDFVTGGFKLWYSTNANATTFPGDGTQIGTSQNYSNTITFSGLSQSISTTTSYVYLTVSTSSLPNPSHNITTTVNSASDITFASGIAAGSFPLDQGDNLLPVELSRFNASSRNGSVYLQWVTETEVNNAGFEVLRKLVGGTNYDVVANYRTSSELRSQTDNGTSYERHTYSFVDNSCVTGSAYTYALRSIDLDGIAETLSMTVNVTVSSMPTEFALQQNYPNPFNNSTMVRFALPTAAKMTLAVFDITGREVIRLVDGEMPAGDHAVSWNGRNATGLGLASGTYFVQMKAGNFKSTRKIALLK